MPPLPDQIQQRPGHPLPKANLQQRTLDQKSDNSGSSSAVLYEPAQFFGAVSIKPRTQAGKSGAVVQFVIPGLRIAKKDISSFERLARNCGDVDKVRFDGATGKIDKQFATLVSIAFHYVPEENEEAHKDTAGKIGRLITERFVSLLSFGVGQRLIALHQQVTKVLEGGRFQTRLHPQSKRSNKDIKVEVASELVEKTPTDDVFNALFWLRRGLDERDSLNAYSALMVCLQVLARILVSPETVRQTCPDCGIELGKRTTWSVKVLITSKLDGTEEKFRRLWKVRNAITSHGDEPVTADVLQDVSELKFDAVDFAFKGIKLALELPMDGSPKPSQFFLITDAFLGSE